MYSRSSRTSKLERPQFSSEDIEDSLFAMIVAIQSERIGLPSAPVRNTSTAALPDRRSAIYANLRLPASNGRGTPFTLRPGKAQGAA
jgi:hypothetical protein